MQLNFLFRCLHKAIRIIGKKVAEGEFLPLTLLQGLELAAGAVNIGLMRLNIRDGLRLTGRLGKKKRPMMSQQ